MAGAEKPNLILISVGTLLTSMILAGFILGFFVDSLFQTTPIFLLLFGFLGILGGILKAYKLLTDPELN